MFKSSLAVMSTSLRDLLYGNPNSLWSLDPDSSLYRLVEGQTHMEHSETEARGPGDSFALVMLRGRQEGTNGFARSFIRYEYTAEAGLVA